MPAAATSLKLPAALKSRLREIAERSGVSPHAYMVEALEERVARDELAQRFLAEARAANRAMQRKGTGYAAAEVHAWLERRLAGKSAARPRARKWRE